MEKVIFDMTQKSLCEVLGASNPEALNRLRDHLSPHDVKVEDFIHTIDKLLKI